MNASPRTSPVSQVRSLPAFCLAVLMLLVSACSGMAAGGAEPPLPPPRTPQPRALTLPDVRGMEPADAWGAVTEAGIDWLDDMAMFHDLSVQHREVPAWDWRIVRTVPNAYAPLEPGDPVVAFALKDDEYDFFHRNERMPRPKLNRGRYLPTPLGKTFLGMGDLFEFRYAPGRAPRAAARTRRWPKPTSGLPRTLDPSVEPRRERRLRAALREADSTNLFVTTIPRPGARLRPGRMITFVVRPHPDVEPEVYGVTRDDPGDVYLHYSDGDDDWNVPGWLCPTRFC